MRLPPTSVTAAKSPAGTIDERYLSFCVDLGMIAQPTRFWNPDGSGGEPVSVPVRASPRPCRASVL